MNALKATIETIIYMVLFVLLFTGVVYLATKDYPAEQGTHSKAEHEEVQTVH